MDLKIKCFHTDRDYSSSSNKQAALLLVYTAVDQFVISAVTSLTAGSRHCCSNSEQSLSELLG